MKNMTETQIKYLAGLLDADGSLSFKFCKASSGKTFVYLTLGLTASEKVDRVGYIQSLGEYAGTVCKVTYDKESFSDANKWHVQSSTEISKLLPRITKHMVVKGRHWNNLLNIFSAFRGIDVSGYIEVLKEFSIESRKDTGPIKAKNHPTWAWVAGYLDGDGCYTLSKKGALHVGCITHMEDLDGVNLLFKAFGGTVYEPRLEDSTVLWRRGLGPSHKEFALRFLRKVHKHSQLKKWKIEQMLAFHNQPQRLNEKSATAEVIV